MFWLEKTIMFPKKTKLICFTSVSQIVKFLKKYLTHYWNIVNVGVYSILLVLVFFINFL